MAKQKFKQIKSIVDSNVKNEVPACSGTANIVNKSSTHVQNKEEKCKFKKKLKVSALIHHQRQQATIPIRLNKRLRRLEREEQVKALAAYTVAEKIPVQENLSCNWKLLQQVLDGERIELPPKPDKKRKRHASSSSSIDHKKSTNNISIKSTHTSTTTTLDATNNSYSEAVMAEAIIDGLAKQQSFKKSSSGPVEAWFDNVDPFLLEDDVVMNETRALSSGGEEEDSDGEAVEVDMDRVESFFDDAEKKSEEIACEKQAYKQKKMFKTAIAMDCEMVGVGSDGKDSALARVSIVDRLGAVLYDKYVMPAETVTDYRTPFSGIRAENLVDAPFYSQVQAEVSRLIKGRLLVGHALKNDLHCLLLSHPTHSTRDTSTYPPFRAQYNNFSPSLKNLCRDFLGVAIQEGEHDSVTDARAAMRLYSLHRQQWEESLSSGGRGHFKRVTMMGVKRYKGAPGNRGRRNKQKPGGRYVRKLGTHGKTK